MSKVKQKHILELEGRVKQANSLETDFRAEVVAANLIEQGFDPERIMIVREGGAKRGFSKDVDDAFLQYSAYDFMDYLVIKTNKESIYDILPEGIFHQVKSRRINKDKEDIIEEFKQQRQEEFFARKFFQPFEVEVDNLLVDSYLFEAKYDKRISHFKFIKIFLQYWPVLKLLEREQGVLFLYIIPLLHQIRNSFSDIEDAMSLILGAGISINRIKLINKATNNQFESRLKEQKLGVDFVLGNTFDDGLFDLKVVIGPVSASKMEFFLKNPNGIRILDMLFEIFLPADTFVVREFKLKPEDANFTLSHEERNSYLGINTYL